MLFRFYVQGKRGLSARNLKGHRHTSAPSKTHGGLTGRPPVIQGGLRFGVEVAAQPVGWGCPDVSAPLAPPPQTARGGGPPRVGGQVPAWPSATPSGHRLAPVDGRKRCGPAHRLPTLLTKFRKTKTKINDHARTTLRTRCYEHHHSEAWGKRDTRWASQRPKARRLSDLGFVVGSAGAGAEPVGHGVDVNAQLK